MGIFPQLVLNSIIASSIYAIIALGFNLTYSTTRFFNIAHGVLAAVGGYAVFFLMNKIPGIPFIIDVACGVIVAGFVGYFLDILIYRPLRKRKASNMVLLIASLGAFTVIQALLAILFTSEFQTLPLPASFHKVFDVFGGSITLLQIITFISAIFVFLALLFVLKQTLFGKAVRAIGDDEEVAKIVGIDTNRIMSFVFFIGSAIAGLGGILVGFDTGIEPIMGMPLLLKGVIAVIVGGVGNIYGSIAGAFLLGFIENFGIWKISGEWKDAIAFGVLIIFLLFRPKGMFPK